MYANDAGLLQCFTAILVHYVIEHAVLTVQTSLLAYRLTA